MDTTISQFISALVAIPERQLAGETAAADLIERFLQDQDIAYSSEEYQTRIPKFVSWSLTADGKDVPCLPCGLRSGSIDSKATILASTISSQKNLYDANINFNPFCDVISRSNFYFAPALAINRNDVDTVLRAEVIRGELTVKPTDHTSRNFLVGNLVDPEQIVFTHYDSVGIGTVDNASGTALTLDLLRRAPELLENTLFAICGNEEISYDETIYWGHGYRDFETRHPEVLAGARRILVLDSLGHTEPQTITDIPTMTLAFPIERISEYAAKTTVIAGDLGALMRFYHAENDVPENLSPEFYEQAAAAALRQLGA